MMASMLSFEVLPALNEGDERICLADILMLRDTCLADRELWAVCMETCIGIQDVNSSEMFQTLCITPESLAFDSSGAACFLDLATDPETMYIPPEYEDVGNSYKAHLYSLGMTMLFAAEYNAGESDAVGMGEQLSALVSRMTADEYDERASLHEVMQLCERHLNGKSSQRLCKEMAAIAKLDDSSPESSESSSYDEDSPVPNPKDFHNILPDSQSVAAVIDLQNELPDAAKDGPPPLPLPANTDVSASGSTGSTISDSTSGSVPASGASSGARPAASGAISPPAAFRNSAEDYKHALLDSPVPVPVPSPPKVSRMVALLDNGEIRTLEMAAAGATGSETEAGPGLLPVPTPPPPLTPLSPAISSPVQPCELGTSENSAFQVVWSPRSSKPTSPVPVGLERVAAQPSASSLYALTDAKTVNYANLLSVALDNGGSTELPVKGATSASGTLTHSVVAVSDDTSKKNISNQHRKADNQRAEADLKCVKNKLDELMAKYGQKLSPLLNMSGSGAPLVTAPSPTHDLPELVRRSHQQQVVDESAERITVEPSTEEQLKVPSPSPSPLDQLHLTNLRHRRDELDFEFGPCISPVPTFVRRVVVDSEDSDISEPEPDSVKEEDEEEISEVIEKPKRGILGNKLRVSVVKLRGEGDEDGREGEPPSNPHITAGQLRRLSQANEVSMLADVIEEEEDEERTESEDQVVRAKVVSDKDIISQTSTKHPGESEGEEGSERRGDDEDDSRSTAESGLSDDSDVTACSDIETDARSVSASDSDVDADADVIPNPGLVSKTDPRTFGSGIIEVVQGGDDGHGSPSRVIVVESADRDGDPGGVSEARPAAPSPQHTAAPHTATHNSTPVPAPTSEPSSPAGTPRHTGNVNRAAGDPAAEISTTPPPPPFTTHVAPPCEYQRENSAVIDDDPTSAADDAPSTSGADVTHVEEERESGEDASSLEAEEDLSGRLSPEGVHRGGGGRRERDGSTSCDSGGSSATSSEEDSSDEDDLSHSEASTACALSRNDTQESESVRRDSSGSSSPGSERAEQERSPGGGAGCLLGESPTGVVDDAQDGRTHTPVTVTAATPTDVIPTDVTADVKADILLREVPESTRRDTPEEAEDTQGDTSSPAAHTGVTAEGDRQAEEEAGEAGDMSAARGLPARGGVPARGPPGSGPPTYGEPDRQTQTVQEMLENLGCGLQENELWALCRECTQALSRYRYDLPAYISLETVFIEEGGEVGYQSVPDDRELEVVYLAPELQQHGVVTEKTCLFGIAAMLWSAADYKLPQNQEPALSEQLENLLMSMTQDNQDLRPQVTDVLQVCSEYDRRHEVSSRLICQGLYSDAQKAEHFGKDNALVRDILGDHVKSEQASRHHQLVNCIKIGPELQSQLKPVSERQLAEKPVVRTLHDKLMDEILNPPKKLRKSSRPKIVNVREIFLNSPEMMSDLRRIVGVSREPMENSAFIARQPMRSAHAQQRALQHAGTSNSSSVPNAFQSTATHFTPIVVTANGQQQVSKPQIRSSESLYGDKDRKVAKKMRELKKNLMKTRPALSIAQDVEKDAALSDVHVPNHVQQQQQQQQQSGMVVNGQVPPQIPGQLAPPAAAGAQAGLFPFQVQLQHDPRTGLFQLIPVTVQQTQGSQQQQQQQQPIAQPQQQYATSSHTPPGGVGNHSAAHSSAGQDSVSEAQEMANQIQRESQERRRYLKHTEEELRARVKGEHVDHQRSRSSASSSSRSSEKRPEHKVKSRSRDKDGHHRGRSHTVSSSDLKDDLARATNNVRSRAKEHRHSHSSASASNLKKCNSEENIIDKMAKPSSRTRSHRSEDARTRLKRAKSGSSLDYRGLDAKVKDIQIEESHSHSHHRQRTSHRDSAHKSQPHLDLDLPQDDVRRSRDAGQGRRTRTSQGHEDSHVRSPLGDVAVSPPPSPSLSKDSGVSGLNMKSSGELTLMERLLNSDTIRHQQRLSKVICLLRDEFAFDGYMENGVEDFAMAEYILSLGNLKWETFNNAVTEKYCDLFWQDELLTGLYEAVNGTRPVIEKRVSSNPKLNSPRSTTSNEDHQSHHQQQHQSSHRSPPTQLTQMSSPKPSRKSPAKKPAVGTQPQPHPKQQPQQSQQNHWNGKTRATHDTITGSAFRPIRAVHPEGSAPGGTTNNPEGPVFKPKPMKAPGSHTDTSDSTDNELSHRPRRYRKKSTQLEKGKSSSMHDLFLEKQELEAEAGNNQQLIAKSHSQGNLMDDVPAEHQQNQPDAGMDPHSLHGVTSGEAAQAQNAHKMGIAVSLDGNKPKVVYIRSSESENDSYESNTNAGYHHHPHHHHPAHSQEDMTSQRTRHMRAMANSTAGYRTSNSFAYRYDSDSSSTSDRRNNEQFNSNTLPFQRHNAHRLPQRSHSRDDSQSESSRGSSGGLVGRRLVSAKSEGYLNAMSSGDEFGSRERVYGGARRMFRGSVVYYPAEMEHYLRPEIREFAVQVWNRRKNLSQDTRTKENIEAKMATLDQEMMMEHRQKRKTLRFYQKLVEASRSGKGGEQKNMMSKVAKQLIEMNTKLEFLDSAKKHLEMLYAEQWGLDHYLLYSLSECPPDEPMLLSASENPNLQYQMVKGAPGSRDSSQTLQAGLPEGLMAYLFAQNALSEGYIHQYFYCFRYFVTPAEFLDFLMVKFIAASLSLSPEAGVPVKVKSRSVDLLQVWLEGYYSIDFKHNPELTNMLYDFIKEKVVPVEPSAEYLLELLEDAQDDRHIDLHYPQFCVADDFELQLIQAETPSKKEDKKQLKEWESFKAALHFSAKPQKLRHQTVKARVASLNAERYLSQMEIDKCDNDAYFPRASLARLGDTFMLSDYTSVTLAEQLTYMEQELFRQSHPVHYLNSKAQGVGVALTTPSINKAQSMYRLTAAWEDNQESSLFVGTFTTDDIIQRMIEHSQAISFWVAAEIVCCDSSKAQIAAISKFLTTARLCQEMRNFATCISILDGLENVLVRQVPAWRNLPSKYATIMDEMSSIRVFLKSDSMCLLESDDSRSLPTIPCVLLFLLHVQQLEIGGFRLANTMYKWAKMKSISKVIDQIRIFKDHTYTHAPDYELQDMIRQRMRDLGQQDLHVLAAQHDTNFQKVPSRNIFKRMKGKMGKSGEG